MKAYIIQPYYSFEQSDMDKCFADMVKFMDEIKEDSLWVRCPVCHAKTRVKVNSETVLI